MSTSGAPFWQQAFMTVLDTDLGDVDIPMRAEGASWEVAVSTVTAVYADGGVLRPRRCEVGSWAWVGTDEQGRRRVYQWGWMEAQGVLRDGVTNNQSELAAMLKALEAMPPGWCGTVYSDSEVTIGRFRDGWRLTGIPSSWARRMDAVRERLGDLTYEHLKGHPTKAELAAGRGTSRRSGRTHDVSEHQAFCDALCTRTLKAWGELSGARRQDTAAGG